MKNIKIILFLNILLTLFSCSEDEFTQPEIPKPVEVKIQVPKTITNEVTDISIYSIKISGKLIEAGDTPVTELGFVVGTTSMPTLESKLSKAISQADNNGDFYMTYQSIPSNTTLYFRSYAINSKGVGYGNEIVFTTINEKIYDGDITLSTQQEVINFGKNNYNTINGSLYIRGQVNDLTPLNSLVIVNNAFEVTNSNLINFNGLNNLKVTGNIFPNGFKISDNKFLENFSGLNNLELTRGNFYVLNNSSLMNLSGLTNYKYASAGELRIASCNNLTSLAGLENLVFIGDTLFLQYNEVLSNISALSNLSSISRRIYIQGNNSLQNLNGLEKMTKLEGIIIESNNSLSNLNGLNNLISCNEVIQIDNNKILNDLSALNKITNVQFLKILRNNSLLNLQGLNNLTQIVNWLEISNNSSLINLNGLNNLTKVGYLYVSSNNSLVNLTGLNSLNTITDVYAITIIDNPKLTSLNGLENLKNSTGFIQVTSNDSLNNYCGLKNLFSSSSSFSLNIANNLANPTRQNIVSNCN